MFIVVRGGWAAATARDDAQIRRLFDGEYRSSYGPWGPAQPYGYAAHDMQILARDGDEIVGHAGWGVAASVWAAWPW